MTEPVRPVEPILYQKLGEVAVGWSGVEAHLAEFLTFLLSADRGSMYVLNQTTSVEMQVKWIRTLAEIRFTHPETSERLTDLLNRIEEARLDRNAWVHGLWGTNCELGAVLIQTIRLNRSEWARSELVTAADFDDLIDRIGEIQTEIIFLGRRLGFLPS